MNRNGTEKKENCNVCCDDHYNSDCCISIFMDGIAFVQIKFRDYVYPLAMPKAFNLDNFKHALETLNFPQLYANTFVVCILSVVLELIITFCSSFVIARMEFKHPKAKSLLYGFLILDYLFHHLFYCSRYIRLISFSG